MRAQINQVLAALQSTHAGATPPLGTAPGMLWVDTSTTPSTLYIRDPSDSKFEALLAGGQFLTFAGIRSLPKKYLYLEANLLKIFLRIL